MCGIAGYRVVSGAIQPWADGLPAAAATLAHRGPDDEGIWFSSGDEVGLAHRRLSILDLGPGGHQPMVSRCGQWRMVANGEVYNFRALRAELETLGHRVVSTGDAEVMLAAFAAWGLDAVSRFVGMFAVALWHEPTRRLHLLRDRLGIKPLYYRWDGRVLAFGSELKALRAFDTWAPAIDRAALVDYLRYGYIADPQTIYEQVRTVPPAHHLTLDARGDVELHRYWSPLDHVGHRIGRAEDALADELEALLVDACASCMIADVPVGVLLSGGVDSSVVAALLQRRGGARLTTFTIGFDRPDYDESADAAAVARHLGTDHRSRTLRVDDARHPLTRWGEIYDQPFGDESGIATLFVAQLAAERVKVVLSADGGDELFGGYASYAAALRQWEWIRHVPLRARHPAAAAIDGIDHWLGGRAPTLATIGSRLGARGAGEIFDRALPHFGDRELTALVGLAPRTRASAMDYPGEGDAPLCLWDLHHYLPGDVLTKVDRATMAARIEGREPLLDHRLVEFACSLPLDMRRGPLGAKHLLRTVLHRHVPPALVDRPKRGFAIPVKEWLATDLGGLVDAHLEPSALARQGLFDPGLVGGYRRRLQAGDASVRQRVWLLLAFQLWHARWMA